MMLRKCAGTSEDLPRGSFRKMTSALPLMQWIPISATTRRRKIHW